MLRQISNIIFSTKYRRKCLNYIHDDVIDEFKYVQAKSDFNISRQERFI